MDRRRAARRGPAHRSAVARAVLRFDRAEFDSPVPYPTSCAPQAWAAAAPLLLVRSLLGLYPDVPAGVVRMAPAAPERMLPLRVERIRLAGARVDVEVRADGWTVRRAAGRGAARRRSARLIRRDMSCARGSTCRCDVSASGRRDACSGIDTSRGDRVAGGRDQTTDSAERAGERCVERAGSQGAAPDRAAAGRLRPQARGQDVAGTARQPSRWLRNFRNPVIAAVLLSAVVCPAVGAVGAGLAAALFAGVLVWARRSLACGVVPLRLRGWWWAGSG